MNAAIRETAELFVKLARDVGRELAYDEAGVRWAAEYVEGIRPVEREDQLRVQTALVGSFLGECLIARYGGAWTEGADEWAVDLGGGNLVYPFRQTRAQLEHGSADTIVGLYTAAGDREQGTGDSQPEPTAEDGRPVAGDALRRVAAEFAGQIANVGGPREYGAEMVAFVDEFIENTRPVDDALLDHYTAMVGSVLGESLIRAYGGEWSNAGGAWSVRLPQGDVHPFAAARRHLENGGEASILALFRSVGGEAE